MAASCSLTCATITAITQVLCDPDSPVFAEMEKVRSEWCIRIDGNVKARDPEIW